MCGDRRVVEGVNIEDLFRDDGANKAKEVDEIPLCANCVAEVVGDGKHGEEHLIPMALDRVEQFDGGLSRRRWETRHAGPATCGASQLPPQESGRAPSPIYVSMNDPLGEPAFRRSPTKPIPSWMQFLPNQRQDKPMETELRPTSVLDDYFSPTVSSIADSDTEDLPPPPVPLHKVPVRPTPPTYTPVQMSRPFTLITEEPVQRPSSRRHPGRLPSKHVHFKNSNHSLTDDAAATFKVKSPSESSEFLEKYQPHQVASRSTVNLPLPTFRRHPSPWSHSAGIYKFGTAVTNADVEQSVVSGTGQKHQEEHQSSHHDQVYTYGPSSGFCTGGGDGVYDIGSTCGKQSRRFVNVTFQDQLKRMFGFT